MTELSSRRKFFTKLGSAMLSLPLSWIGLRNLFPSFFDAHRRTTKIAVGRVDELFATKDFIHIRISQKDVVVFVQNGSYTAFNTECTHARCTVQYSETAQMFLCPCHGGEFHRDGSVAKSPPSKPLQRLFVSVHDDVLYLSDRVVDG